MSDCMYTISGPNTKDHPGWYVVRRHRLTAEGTTPDPGYLRAPTLKAARLAIPEGLECVPRMRHDPAVVLETWGDPRFAAILRALNELIEQGYISPEVL